ncbi:MAG TPA: hypothetical protein VM657_13885 [Sphingomonas sp.]|nr:hypothetical protein [Sphingomonas sp.]
MNMKTPCFRAALTVAAVWIVIFASLSYSDYRQAYRSTEYAGYDIPEEETYQCRSTILDVTKPGFQFREQTSDERSACYKKAAQAHVRLIESGNRFALEQAWKAFGWRGALPALALLAVVAFWTSISAGVGRAASSYFNWLRFGSTKPDTGSKDNEP